MAEAEHRQIWGKQLLQLHHIIGIATYVDQGVTDANVVNAPENLITLCYFCHKEWHTFAEPLELDFKAWMARQPVFNEMGRTPPEKPLDDGPAKFMRKARLKNSTELL